MEKKYSLSLIFFADHILSDIFHAKTLQFIEYFSQTFFDGELFTENCRIFAELGIRLYKFNHYFTIRKKIRNDQRNSKSSQHVFLTLFAQKKILQHSATYFVAPFLPKQIFLMQKRFNKLKHI
ncbi:hypothetical protein BpHYR1_010298 [Brachionus plicatilis]|uniref:Uncharacterized protein n=1 Tax=Brachionus plicatilis TaxID=10195 RepID=A0A3M7QA50_BRAPC|nr:hypothetical protein BpHYR1_010298 [Brachionus plicatilis]